MAKCVLERAGIGTDKSSVDVWLDHSVGVHVFFRLKRVTDWVYGIAESGDGISPDFKIPIQFTCLCNPFFTYVGQTFFDNHRSTLCYCSCTMHIGFLLCLTHTNTVYWSCHSNEPIKAARPATDPGLGDRIVILRSRTSNAVLIWYKIAANQFYVQYR